MDNIIKSVIDIDKQARLRAEDVKAFRDNALQSLEKQKADMLQSEKNKADELITKNAQACYAKAKKALEKLSADEGRGCEELEKMYLQHKDEWVKEIVNNVIS